MKVHSADWAGPSVLTGHSADWAGTKVVTGHSSNWAGPHVTLLTGLAVYFWQVTRLTGLARKFWQVPPMTGFPQVLTGHATECAGTQVAVKLQSNRTLSNCLSFGASKDLRIVTKEKLCRISRLSHIANFSS